MLRQFSVRRIVGFFLTDWLGTLLMLALAGFLRTRMELSGTLRELLPAEVFLLVALIWPAALVTFCVYDGRHSETLRAELWHVLQAVVVGTLALAGALYFSYRLTSRSVILLFAVLDLTLLWSERIALWLLRHRKPRHGVATHTLLVIGAGNVGLDVVRQLRKFAWVDLDVLGYADDDPHKQGQRFEELPVLGTLDEIPALAVQHRIKYAIVALPLYAHERLIAICRALQKQDVHVYVVPDLFALSFPSATLEGFGGIPVVDLGQPGIHGGQRIVKRAFDVVAIFAGLLFIWPLLLVTAVLIKLDSPGPVFYRQRRIGENGRPFDMLKFRSMRAGADEGLHRAHVTRLIQENLDPAALNGNSSGTLKLEHDPRITRIGAFIRKTSIDELPQIFNVLRGEMSLVGPRPALPYEVEVYQDWHKRRFEAIPGITGWWQVKGRNRVSFDEAVRLDIYYIEHQSFWFDVWILLRTPAVVISGRGAG